MTTMLTRAQFIEWTALSGLGAVFGCDSESPRVYPACARTPTRGDLAVPRRFEFFHGVASGDPTARSVVLWTRVTCCDGRDADASIRVAWEIATDAGFARVVACGSTVTSVARDYSVKVDVDGLPADTRFVYRFFDPDDHDDQSPVGRTRTLPAGHLARVTFAATCCTAYSVGYFNSYGHMAQRDDLQFVMHLGDYIYEYGTEAFCDDSLDRRPCPEHELVTLEDYRTRYAQVRSDPDLQAAHGAHPFVSIWDDHEVADDVWDGGADGHGRRDGTFAARREAAIQAYLEWMPVRETIRDGHVSLYREVVLGDLVDLAIVDARLECRDEQGPATAEDPSSTLIGGTQEQWLHETLCGSNDRGDAWRILVTPVLMMQLDIPDFSADLAGWQGYPAVRERLFDLLEAEAMRDVVVLSGDFHAAIGAEIARDPFDPSIYDPETGRGTLLPEITVTSATSPAGERFIDADGPDVVAATHPHIRHLDPHLRGYAVLDVDAEHVVVDVLRARTIRTRDRCHTRALRFTVDRGNPCLRIGG